MIMRRSFMKTLSQINYKLNTRAFCRNVTSLFGVAKLQLCNVVQNARVQLLF